MPATDDAHPKMVLQRHSKSISLPIFLPLNRKIQLMQLYATNQNNFKVFT